MFAYEYFQIYKALEDHMQSIASLHHLTHMDWCSYPSWNHPRSYVKRCTKFTASDWFQAMICVLFRLRWDANSWCYIHLWQQIWHLIILQIALHASWCTFPPQPIHEFVFVPEVSFQLSVPSLCTSEVQWCCFLGISHPFHSQIIR